MEEVGWIKEIGRRREKNGARGERGGTEKKRKMKVDNHTFLRILQSSQL